MKIDKQSAKEYLRISVDFDSAVMDELNINDKGVISVKEWRRTRRRPIDFLPRKRIREIIADNVSLIKTISKEFHPFIADRIYRLIKFRADPEKTVDWLIDECGVSENRAYLIATDQVRKALERIKLEYWKGKGIQYVIWHHKEDREPRDYHLDDWDGVSGIRNGRPNALNGFVFDIDNPPVIDKDTGERGYPSTLIGCKCYLTGIRE